MIDDPRRVAIVAIGDELIIGARTDTNSGEIARRLTDRGLEVARCVVMPDDQPRLERLFMELCETYSLVLVTGGLGPTLDDVTRHAASAASGHPLFLDPEVEADLRERWASRGKEMPEANLRQALFPVGSQVMPNHHGTAPGFRVWVDGSCLACFPGPPRELLPMLAGDFLPWFDSTCGRLEHHASAEFHLVGLPESEFAELAGDWMQRDANPRMGVCASQGTLYVRLSARGTSAEAVTAKLQQRSAAFRERYERHIYSEDEADLGRVVARLLMQSKRTLALAESCTGGLLGARLTAEPGISASLLEGWVTYSNRAKTERLGVSAELIEQHGAVSAQVAEAMAQGAAERSGADFALSITGIAGPDGGSEDKPVGSVYVGMFARGEAQARLFTFAPLGRDLVRAFSVHAALEMLRRALIQDS